jgi:hypothetical protein
MVNHPPHHPVAPIIANELMGGHWIVIPNQIGSIPEMLDTIKPPIGIVGPRVMQEAI